MDPEIITSGDWSSISGLLKLLWVYVVFVVVFAKCVLLAQAIIPSLVTTHHLPDRALRLRPLLLGVASISFLLAAITMINVLSRVGLIGNFYERWWI